ncbi:hypothetical protein LMB76_06555 [Limosilactobacillus reuteri]|uniref:DUF1642 domain-containing protein n=1 Tax=Limosilactobacillus reuteri TaxID=1598 RepID=A0AAW4X5M3_LIMRT|nr:hypothetical protein [Limosilactobacillus reuteri]MCC4477876.1 hypothetical protein [Limosilactobacillus reuteri]MCC4480082.1 hypothetical protein [Limosilactobacillus reuteri]MCC4488911.1 hypothetical protein [Limosilactobacillus reuteri]MCC4493560.1 hypothetical protein [Limosilactobacillus reuteri]MCC4495275.1 hypothetical protein [Limosilactobacillus reuteri]
MKTYSYPAHEKEDIKQFIEARLDAGTFGLLIQGDEDTIEDVKDLIFDQDDITGNMSGSYTMNTRKAEENLVGNWDLLEEAINEFDLHVNPIEKGAEWCDSLIRCYLVDWCFTEALKEITKQETKN